MFAKDYGCKLVLCYNLAYLHVVQYNTVCDNVLRCNVMLISCSSICTVLNKQILNPKILFVLKQNNVSVHTLASLCLSLNLVQLYKKLELYCASVLVERTLRSFTACLQTDLTRSTSVITRRVHKEKGTVNVTLKVVE